MAWVLGADFNADSFGCSTYSLRLETYVLMQLAGAIGIRTMLVWRAVLYDQIPQQSNQYSNFDSNL